MDVFEYNMLPLAFRKAFEKENGDMPDSEFIARIWFDIACKWHAGWQLAIDHANELRPPMPPLPAPERTRTFMVTLEPGMLPVIHETKLPANAPQPSGLRDDYVESLKETPRPDFQQEPAPTPLPPPWAVPNPQGHAAYGSRTAAEMAAESVKEDTPRKFIIINASSNPDNSWRWLVEVERSELTKIGSYPNREEANAALKKIEGGELMGSIYAISDERLRFWQQNPNLLYIAREEFATVRGEKPPRG